MPTSTFSAGQREDQLGGAVVECPPRVSEVPDLIPGRVIPKTLKMIVMAAILGTRGYGIGFALRLAYVQIQGPVVLVTYPGKVGV